MDDSSIEFESKQITSITGIDNYLEKTKESLKVGEDIIKWALDEKWSIIEKYTSSLNAMGINYDFNQPTAKMAKDLADCIGDTGTRLTRLLVKIFLKPEKILDSICTDKTHFGETREDHTDDLKTTITLEKPKKTEA